MYVYVNSEPGLWTVGFYKPDGAWQPESDHESKPAAAERVAWLNGAREPACDHPVHNNPGLVVPCPSCSADDGSAR